ncbi:MAG TPA: class I SAM-dependent methyltransferase [Desulfovibrio sp.]|nr:class I SAM-dependent methyltransferase [Desulfovibrio sp.]
MSAISRLGITPDANARPEYSPQQEQTASAFGYQWSHRHTYESEAMKSRTRTWLVERYCGGDPARLDALLAGERKIILDAGCGAAFSALLLFGEHLKQHDYLGVDISSAVDVARARFAEAGYPGDFLRASLTDIPVPDGSLDMIFSEGVLHHTDSTRDSLAYLSRKLKPGGMFLFYVYVKKAVIREFTDDHVRDALRGMTDEQAWEALKPLTSLGIALGELGVELDVPEDIPFLGIRKGKLDLQRFVYWNICKMYHAPELTFDEMHLMNFDWFRPLNCQRHTPEELREYCKESGLVIEHMDIQEAGLTVVARKA